MSTRPLLLNLMPIGLAHLPGVMAVQARAYGASFQETPEVLGSKLNVPGQTCWGAFMPDEQDSVAALCAYAIAHTLPPGTPLELNKVLAGPRAPQPDDWLYVHDIAVDPDCAGAGLAAQLLARVLEAGQRLGLRRAMLVAVQGAGRYWARHGFVARPAPVPLLGFGADAVWMSRTL